MKEKIENIQEKIKKITEQLDKKNEESKYSKIYRFILEKGLLLILILVYIILIANSAINNYISKTSMIYAYLGLVVLVIFLFDKKKTKKKIGLHVLVYIAAICLLFYAGDGKLSENALKNKRVSRYTTKAENTAYEFKEGLNGKPATQADPSNPTLEFKEPVLKKNISYDFESGTFYINNRIFIIFENTTTYKMAVEFGEKNNMRLVGQTSEVNQFTYELPNQLDYRRMGEQKEIISQLDEVRIADFDIPPIEAVQDLKKEGVDKVSEEKKKELYNKYINEEGVVQVTFDNYLKVLEYIYQDPAYFEGKQIEFSGRTFTDENMEDKQIGIGMWQMYCCALDMNLVGYLAKDTKDLNLELDKWYSVKGVIRQEMQLLPNALTKSLEPIIELDEVEEIEEPQDKIVY